MSLLQLFPWLLVRAKQHPVVLQACTKVHPATAKILDKSIILEERYLGRRWRGIEILLALRLLQTSIKTSLRNLTENGNSNSEFVWTLWNACDRVRWGFGWVFVWQLTIDNVWPPVWHQQCTSSVAVWLYQQCGLVWHHQQCVRTRDWHTWCRTSAHFAKTPAPPDHTAAEPYDLVMMLMVAVGHHRGDAPENIARILWQDTSSNWTVWFSMVTSTSYWLVHQYIFPRNRIMLLNTMIINEWRPGHQQGTWYNHQYLPQ